MFHDITAWIHSEHPQVTCFHEERNVPTSSLKDTFDRNRSQSYICLNSPKGVVWYRCRVDLERPVVLFIWLVGSNERPWWWFI